MFSKTGTFLIRTVPPSKVQKGICIASLIWQITNNIPEGRRFNILLNNYVDPSIG